MRVPQWTRSESCLSDLALERLLASELAFNTAERVTAEAHLASCALCQRRRDELVAAPEQQLDQLWWQKQLAPRRPTRPIIGAGVLAFAAAAVLVLVLRPKTTDGPAQVGSDTRGKGPGFSLELVAKRTDGRVEPVFGGTILHPGDAIRFIVSAPEAGELAIVGMDAVGQTSLYFPVAGQAATVATGRRDLPGSIVLDEILGDERLQALLCPTAPEREALVSAGKAALARAGNVPSRIDHLDVSCRQTGISIHKQAREPGKY